MTMRQSPPTRTSSSQTGFVKPSGPHHRASCSGSVHASNTTSGGASKNRVMTISRSCDSAAPLVLLLPDMTLRLPLLHLPQIIVQTVQAFFPEAPVVPHPVRDFLQRTRFKTARSPLGFLSACNQARTLQDL